MLYKILFSILVGIIVSTIQLNNVHRPNPILLNLFERVLDMNFIL